jgi:PucR-like helix-turn-helix protein/purine catabolism regulatory family protein/diguanylate cyclase with GGDEF domain
MPITVSELLATRHLKLEPLVDGDGERVISWVHSSEMPDPSAYLRGDEVVLSAGIWYWAGSSARAFAAGLARAGAAAVGFGTSPLVPEVPADLVASCREDGLALFHVPPDVPFIAVTEAFVERYVADRERPLLDARERNEQLVHAVQERLGVRGVLRVLARHRRGAAWVVERGRGLVASTGERPPAAVVAAFEDALGRDDRRPPDVPGWIAFPIVAAGADAWLVAEAGADELPVAERAAIEQAAAFVAIDLQRDVAVRESERRFAAELVDLIVAGEAQLPAAAARLEAFGLDPGGPLCALVAEGGDDGIAAMERLLAGLGVRGVAAVKGLQVVAIVPGPGAVGEVAELARRVRAALGAGAAVGVGGVAAGAAELRRSLIEAQQACHFARRRADGYAVHAEVGSHALLLALQDEGVLAAFRDALLRPLVEHDARRQTELVRTLELFLESGGAYQPTAEALHVHVNTLRGRLARIEELTGRSLSDMESRVDFFIALRARP